jgi:hypothetical protein
MADGGWNCEWLEGSTRSSFSIQRPRGLLSYEAATYPFRWFFSVLNAADYFRAPYDGAAPDRRLTDPRT